ncbi:predicted protein [Lichtheimia corymbifera JMRC:FSU:9682]|uniref:F-box domain-containing protein n=1 Tax=Lichtheimia corymbifera JMRC:FSU:9682 TaxID=1263082 RepID=A0A068SHS9_9FUNG|nr:predicted protein [Lichtheimia corymbifera JMRC:FSU:9682]
MDYKDDIPNVHASTTAAKKCVDFISDLPWEIVKSNIVPRILGEGRPVFRLSQPWPYLDVCSTWTRLIVLADDSFYFILGSRYKLSGDYGGRISMVAPYIKTLAMFLYNEESMDILLKSGTLMALTKLTIRVDGSQQALQELLDISPNLTHLDLKYFANIDMAIFELLDRCPKLIRLNLLVGGKATMDTTTRRQHNRSYGTIIHLEAVCEDSNKTDIFLPLIQRLPNLRHLSLTFTPSFSALDIIQTSCPKLQELYTSYPTLTYDVHDDVRCVDEGQGLKVLSFDGKYDLLYVADIMMRHSATLESLVFKKDAFFITSTPRLWEQCDIQFSHLRTLSYEDRKKSTFIHFIDWVIEHAPNLRSVETIHGPMQRRHLDSTLRYRPLQRIGLYSTTMGETNEHPFLQYHLQLGTRSHLQEIKCTFLGFIRNDTWLALIPQLTQLKTLELCFHDNVSPSGLKVFIQQVANGCIGLEKVILKAIYFPYPYDWISALAKHPNLKELVVDMEADTAVNLMLGVEQGLPKELYIALEAFAHLKTLYLKHDIGNWEPIIALKRKVPNLVYTERHNPI